LDKSNNKTIKIDPNLREKLLSESKNPFYGLRRILWFVFTGSALIGVFIMVSRFAGGNELNLNDLLIQIGASILFLSLLFIDRKKEN